MEDITLALGGGGIKGIAHVGVYQRLLQAGYNIRAVAGTSAGGIAGSLIAAGYTPDQMADIMSKLDVSSNHMFQRDASDGPSLLGLRGIADLLDTYIGDRTFKDLKIPFACTAVDINRYREVVFNQGSVKEAVLATAAFPGVFPPRQYGDMQLVDGGVLDPVPVSVARMLSPNLPVVAVCLSPVPEGWGQTPPMKVPETNPLIKPIIGQFSRLRIAQAFIVFAKSMDTTSHMLAELRLQIDRPDAVIRPDVTKWGLIDPVDPDELIHAGIIATDACLPEIKQANSWASSLSRRFFRSAPLPENVIFTDEESLKNTEA